MLLYTSHLLNAFLLTVVLIPLLARLATRIGLVDLPQGRKLHEGAVPLTGGLAIFMAFLLPALELSAPASGPWALLSGLALLLAIGILDDLLDLGPWTKLAAQTGAALLMVLPGALLLMPADLFGGGFGATPLLALAFTVLFIVATINSFNMIDGLDGLAGGAAAAALFWLTIAAALTGHADAVGYLLLLLSAVLGFLVFNMRHPWRRRAVVFMGDAGSMVLGAAIAFFAVELVATGRGTAASAIPLPVLLWLIVVPATDMLVLFCRRIAEGRSPLVGDRRHLHHLLLQAGFSPAVAAGGLIGLCVLLGGIGIAGWRLGVPAPLMLAGLVAPFLLHLGFVWRGWQWLRDHHPAASVALPADGLQSITDQAA
jgi:UDP-GlcNAc:undecaprenyl-phosphate GlcNAc-1-phosphate transferase